MPVLAFTMFVAACKNDTASTSDGGADSGRVACENPGHFSCNGTSSTNYCYCDGTGETVVDGACHTPPDGGRPPHDCTASPEWKGCPCSTEGEVYCFVYDARIVCTSGVWVEDPGVLCCPSS